MLRTVGERRELFVCQIIFMGVAAATLTYGLERDFLVSHIQLLTSLEQVCMR